MQVDIPSPQSPGLSHHIYHLTQTIDDVVYRYSADSDRGTPREGIYAQDGLWDDDELSSEATTIRPSSGSTFGHHSSRRQSRPGPTPPASTKSRSRSGTVTSAARPEEKSGMWTWGKKAAVPMTPVPVPMPEARAEVVTQPKGLEKKKSKSLLRGKGRRGELSVNVSPGDPDESFEAPPPLPPTPASYMTHSSPAVSTASVMTPASYPSRLEVTTPDTPALDKGPKSSWRRGMKNIFKSKSSVALREAFANVDPNRPPLPQGGLPSKPSQHALGKPFSSSTPPMPSAAPKARDTMWSFYSNSPLSPPPSALDSFGLPSHPSLPADPFASSLDLSSNRIPHSPSVSPALPPKSRLSRNSPSLRDLKQFLAPSKPSLTKAKSLANIREKAALPASAPPTRTEYPQNKTVKRVSSVLLSSTKHRETSVDGEPVRRPALLRPTLSRIPTESPPLLPPNPPYFPTSFLPTKSGLSTPSSIALSIDTALDSPSLDNPPPTSPLPALPLSSPMSPMGSATVPIKRSGSSAVLLPRSRSTSMSLKAPPTSSSFFDLYEQLGIWPTPSDKEAASPEKSPEVKTKELQSMTNEETNQKLTVSNSPSATFSAGSWEAAISAFPLVDDIPAPGSMSMDFGQPQMADQDLHLAPAPYTSFFDADGDISMTSNIAVGGSTCSLSTEGHDSSHRAAQGSSSKGNGANPAASTGYSYASLGLGPIRNSGSNNSSGSPSRDERRSHSEGKWFDGTSGRSSQSSSDDEDDQPLSKLHPEAHVVQNQAAIKRRATRKAAKARAKGRNPGGGVRWDGEGGVPADALRTKLESMLLTKEMRVYNWQLSQGHAVASSSKQRDQSDSTGRLRPVRSFTDPHRSEVIAPAVQRSQTVKRDSEMRDRPAMVPPILTMASPNGGATPLPISQAVGPSRHTTLRKHDAFSKSSPTQESFSTSLRDGPSPTSSSHHTSSRTHVPSGPNVTRSNTAATSRSATSRTRSRAMSNAASTQQPDSAPHARAVTEPIPQRKQHALSANAFIGSMNGRRIVLELYPETTARDVLHASQSRGELPELATGTNWAVVEISAELGYERQIREYEPLQVVLKGWDPSGRSNCFVFRQSNTATATWTRASLELAGTSIPRSAPFLGGYVQYETKKGKWSKRFLETRGGQVFLSKNDKNKEEMQINTMFHDVHFMTRSYNSPKPFVFIMKRVEPASSFENPNDYLHVFSAEESIGWKLLSAIYDAKSHTIAQSKPQLLMGAPQAVHRRPTAKTEGPYIDLEKRPVEKSAFTGKGLLRI